MKIIRSRRCSNSGSIMAEACIGLALMAFAWIIITYSLYMADNKIRTEMAARHAAWYFGATQGKQITADEIDRCFFYQSGVSNIKYTQGKGISDLFGSSGGGSVPPPASTYAGFNGVMATVTYGPKNPHNTDNPFPFSLLNTHVPFMPDSFLTNCTSVSSSCQWDIVGDTWSTPSKAWAGIMGILKAAFGVVGSVAGKLFGF